MMPLLSFLAPTRLWLLLLIPLLVVIYLLMVRRKRNRSTQLGKTMFDLVIPRDRTWLRHLAVGLSILSLLTLTLAFAKPKDQVSVPRERATIVVTIDVSLSMEAKDVEPNRLDAAKSAAEQFVNVVAAEVQCRAGVIRRHRDDSGAADARSRCGDSRNPGRYVRRPRRRLARGSTPRWLRWPRCRLTPTTRKPSHRHGSSCSAMARHRSAALQIRLRWRHGLNRSRSTPSRTEPPTAISISVAGESRCQWIAPSWRGSPRSVAARRTRRRPQASSKRSTGTSEALSARKRSTGRLHRDTPVSGWDSRFSRRSE